MGTSSLIPNNKKGLQGIKMLPRHRKLCDEFLANGLNASAAAKTLGYKKHAVTALNIMKRPEVRRYLEFKLADIAEEQTTRREQVIAKMQRLNDFNLMLYSRGGDGNSIIIDAEHYDEVAELIGDCVTKITTKTREFDDGGSETTFELELMSKDKMFDRELKYLGIIDLDGNGKIDLTVKGGVIIDLDELAKPPALDDNIIEVQIEKG